MKIGHYCNLITLRVDNTKVLLIRSKLIISSALDLGDVDSGRSPGRSGRIAGDSESGGPGAVIQDRAVTSVDLDICIRSSASERPHVAIPIHVSHVARHRFCAISGHCDGDQIHSACFTSDSSRSSGRHFHAALSKRDEDDKGKRRTKRGKFHPADRDEMSLTEGKLRL
ncbi:hypothetical protein PENTCL1PPCAC_15570 [Pristionchus entomophagus]|uniref:Uncharacterized protein n=1 Tax=Pristionchus entomophagus TaxID=358040 RepID=A0AAV5TCV4_9BILA|nr:hypothetical protein PENTCL1PPCAC_15570 [Pristionchus entomophagus]